MKKKIFISLLAFVLAGATSCKKDFLDEVPLDFLSGSNAYVTYADFNIAVNDMYRVTRTEFYTRDENYPFDYLYGCDIVFDGQPYVGRHTPMSAAYSPAGGINIPATHWSAFYKIISEANAIIDRAVNSAMTADQKALVTAKAKFFRAMSFRSLAYLFGGVPLVTSEVTTPKTDFVRATREQVYAQCIDDLKAAVAGLPSIQTVTDGEISNQAANHLLAEVYLAAGQFQNAVDAATKVISDSNVRLMTNRFGSKSSVTTGNVYWDLFQPGNQNRRSGNMEGLWVIQFETDVLGGASVTTGQGGNYLLERHVGPNVSLVTISPNPFVWPTDDLTGGRGVGWALSTRHFSDAIWASDFNNDIRNANINFVRNIPSNNPASPRFGQIISTQNPPAGITVPSRQFYAYAAKATTPFSHPAALIQNAATGLLKGAAGGTYLDQYMFRLAETYFIRAEAYMKLNNPAAAADDLNIVRRRSNANPVAAADVNIDYILDERMRELSYEEKRRLTLMRLGLWADRVRRFNPYYANDVQDKYNLWPIPQTEIERNNTGTLTQNPGY